MANNTYFNARSKAMETKILTYDDFVSLVNTKNLDEMTKKLNDYRLLQGITATTYADLKQIINREEEEFLVYLKRNNPKENVAKFFVIKYDYFNVECIYLQEKLGKNDLKLTHEGYLTHNTIRNCIKRGNYSELSNFMQNCLEYLDKKLKEEEPTGFVIDTAFKKALYEEMLYLSKCDKNLYEYTNYLIDLMNIQLSLRFRDAKIFDSLRLKGGTLKTQFFKKLTTDDLEKVLLDTKFSPYNVPINLIVQSKLAGEPFIKFDFLIDCLGETHFHEFKYNTDGILPYIRYCFLKRNELINMRIVFEGLSKKRPKKSIINELRRVYEG